MTRGTLSPRALEIVTAARELLERDGPDALSMRRVAERLGIKAPSIYKHLPDKKALEHALISTAFRELAATFAVAVREPDPLTAVAAAYRRYGQEHPHLYRLMTERPLDRDMLEPGAEDSARLPALLLANGDLDVARALWAFAHGMTILELDGRFPPGADLDTAWERGLQAFRPT